MDKIKLYYEEPENIKSFFRKGEKRMDSKVKSTMPKQKPIEKTKKTLSIYTYMNFRQFGLAVRIEDGIKVTLLFFETHIKFEKTVAN